MATYSTAYSSTTDTTALTLTAASLATSSTLTVGRESTVVSNATNLDLDHLLSGLITTGTSPTGGSIQVWIYSVSKLVSSTYTYTGGATGSDAALTLVAEVRNQLALAYSVPVNTTSNTGYHLRPRSIASLFGGVMPLAWGAWLVHSTGVNLNSTAGNHYLHYTRVKASSA